MITATEAKRREDERHATYEQWIATDHATDRDAVDALTALLVAEGDQYGGDAPGSPYGVKPRQWAPVAALHTLLVCRATGEWTPEAVEHSVGLVVNGSETVATDLAELAYEGDGTVNA